MDNALHNKPLGEITAREEKSRCNPTSQALYSHDAFCTERTVEIQHSSAATVGVHENLLT